MVNSDNLILIFSLSVYDLVLLIVTPKNLLTLQFYYCHYDLGLNCHHLSFKLPQHKNQALGADKLNIQTFIC